MKRPEAPKAPYLPPTLDEVESYLTQHNTPEIVCMSASPHPLTADLNGYYLVENVSTTKL
jgi:hypothetical protein